MNTTLSDAVQKRLRRRAYTEARRLLRNPRVMTKDLFPEEDRFIEHYIRTVIAPTIKTPALPRRKSR